MMGEGFYGEKEVHVDRRIDKKGEVESRKERVREAYRGKKLKIYSML